MTTKIFDYPGVKQVEVLTTLKVTDFSHFYIREANLVQTRFGERIIFRCSFYPDQEPTFAFFLAPTQNRLNALQLMVEVWKEHPDAAFGPVRLRKLSRGYVFERYDPEAILD